ncbi:MAG: hypothetical protein QXY62_05000 [Candidatus Altiarchaeota archaeon]
MENTNKIFSGILLMALFFSVLPSVYAQQKVLYSIGDCTLDIEVQPGVASIFLDGEWLGIGKYLLRKVTPGTHVVEVRTVDEKAKQTVTCISGTVKVKFNLEKAVPMSQIPTPKTGSLSINVLNTQGKSTSAQLFYKPKDSIGVNKIGGDNSLISKIKISNIKPGSISVIGKKTDLQFINQPKTGLDKIFNFSTVPRIVFRSYSGSSNTLVRTGETSKVNLQLMPKFCDIIIRVVDENGNPIKVELYSPNGQVGGYGSYFSSYRFFNLKPNLNYVFKGKRTDTLFSANGIRLINYYGEVLASCQPGEVKEVTLVVKRK